VSFAFWSLLALVLSEAFAMGVAHIHSGDAVLPSALAALVWWLFVALVFLGGAAWLKTPDGKNVDRYGIPNGLTALRAWACIPLLVVAVLSLPGNLALVLWVAVGGVVGLLDAVDGLIARRFGPVTVLGKAMDPFGDALFFVVGALGSYLLGIVPFWLAVLIAFRYAAPVLFTPLVLLLGRRPELVHTVWGRRNTLLTGIVMFTLFWVRVAGGPVWLAALFAALPTLVPTDILHFVSLAQRVLAAPAAR
jgi:phosphatidylglycerophosphate synthase